MARKVDYTFEAEIELNEDKGGAWLATCCKGYMDEEGQFIDELTIHTPWKNAAAAKRWIKAKVLELTPRKSVKMEPVKTRTCSQCHGSGELYVGDENDYHIDPCECQLKETNG